MAGKAEEAVDLRAAAGGRSRLMLGARGRGASLGRAARARRGELPRQLAYLFDRSPFYREKLGRGRIRRPAAAGGLDDIARAAPHRTSTSSAPRTARAIRSARTSAPTRPRSSGSTRRAAPRARRATSRSTAGRPRQLGHRVGAQLRGVRRRCRRAHRLDLQRRPVRGGRGARRLRADRALPHPGRHREHRAADARDRAARARRGRC